MVVVSFERSFIFMKTRKTAGTSMEIALSTYAGKDGVLTPISPVDEIVRYRVSPDALPQNFTDAPAEEEKYRDGIRRDAESGLADRRKRPIEAAIKYYAHMPAQELRNGLPEAFWNEAFKFTIERHPYEKAVSKAYFRLWKKDRTDFENVLEEVVQSGEYRNYDIYAIDGTVVADMVIRFETMDDGIRQVEGRCGIDIASRMPSAKSNYRTDRRPAGEILAERQKEIVRERCAEEFELFGYEA